MTQYNTLNVKLSNSQLNKSKLEMKNGTEVTLKISSNVVCDSNDEDNVRHNLLITNTQVSRLRKASANGSSANLKISKTQSNKNSTIRRIFRYTLFLMRNLLKPLAKSILIPLGLTQQHQQQMQLLLGASIIRYYY